MLYEPTARTGSDMSGYPIREVSSQHGLNFRHQLLLHLHLRSLN